MRRNGGLAWAEYPPPVPVAEFCNFQPDNDGCKAGRKEGLEPLTLDESTGVAIIAREEAERKKQEAEQAAAAAAEKERIAKELAAAEALSELERQLEQKLLAQYNSQGPVRAYPKLASYRYKKCQDSANDALTIEARDGPLYAAKLERIEKCAADAETALGVEVKLALHRASPKSRRCSQGASRLHRRLIARPVQLPPIRNRSTAGESGANGRYRRTNHEG
ncbi:MAG: hypothetical protein IPK27_19900 [Rhodanobacteraceae bacterium]|nr:hypothetical protein [Rhodanobacteraceae bacterium]